MALANSPSIQGSIQSPIPSLIQGSIPAFLSTVFPMKSPVVNNSPVIGFFAAVSAPRGRHIPVVFAALFAFPFTIPWRRAGYDIGPAGLAAASACAASV